MHLLSVEITVDDVYEDIDDYNTSRKRKVIIVFDDMMIADIMTNKKNSNHKELFIRCKKVNI